MKNFLFSKEAKFLVAFLGLCMYAFVGNAQSFTLSGKVSNEKQEPLVGATVLVKKSNKGVTADFSGNFKISVVAGTYEVAVSYVGYTTKTQTVVVTGNQKIDFQLQSGTNILDEVLVSGVRVKADAPVTHSNMDKAEIAKRNLGQDIPVLLNYLPSVVTTSDAGAGIGYTGIRVRGSDATRVNVTINGIPYNDSESMGTFWVNIGDFASSVENLQLQRGVGTSTNGAGAFGASLNMLTDGVKENQSAQISSSVGSFNTLKNTVKFSTGLLNDHIEFSGRFSKIRSDGFIERAKSDLESYFIQGNYKDENTLIKALIFGGEEITYQAWYGSTAETLASNRRFNGAGLIYNPDYSIRAYYDNQVDNYKQDHFQLHWSQKYSDELSSNIAVHYTRARGFYEEYNQVWGDDPIAIENQSEGNTDNITRRYANSHFYGTTFNVNYQKEQVELTIGGAANRHDGRHFGETIWSRFPGNSEIRDVYYDRPGDKRDFNLYAKATYSVNDKLKVFADLQQRRIQYDAEVKESPMVEKSFNFFNPKAGISYTANEKSNYYFSYSKAHREPTRGDFEEIANVANFPKPEELNDFELGWRYKKNNLRLNTNVYYMHYIDQLVLTGQIDLDGAFKKTNSGESFRAGIEIDADIYINKYLSVRPNLTFSRNENIDFNEDKEGVVSNIGNTKISFSPEITGSNAIVVRPIENLEFSIFSKYVSEQFLTNYEEDDKKLDKYFTNDISLTYVVYPKSIFESISFNGMVNNIFSEEYESNGYFDPDWGTYYYPQATRNFLVGMTLKF
jgi:iron complex outermembrane recepter protein